MTQLSPLDPLLCLSYQCIQEWVRGDGGGGGGGAERVIFGPYGKWYEN